MIRFVTRSLTTHFNSTNNQLCLTIACRCVPTTTVSRAEEEAEEESVAVAVAVAVAEEEEYILKEENIKYSVITNNGVNSESQTRFSIT